MGRCAAIAGDLLRDLGHDEHTCLLYTSPHMKRLPDTELEVMKALWAQEGGAARAELEHALRDKGWASNTCLLYTSLDAILEALTRSDEDVWLITPVQEGLSWSLGLYDAAHGLRFADALAVEELRPLLPVSYTHLSSQRSCPKW